MTTTGRPPTHRRDYRTVPFRPRWYCPEGDCGTVIDLPAGIPGDPVTSLIEAGDQHYATAHAGTD